MQSIELHNYINYFCFKTFLREMHSGKLHEVANSKKSRVE